MAELEKEVREKQQQIRQLASELEEQASRQQHFVSVSNIGLQASLPSPPKEPPETPVSRQDLAPGNQLPPSLNSGNQLPNSLNSGNQLSSNLVNSGNQLSSNLLNSGNQLSSNLVNSGNQQLSNSHNSWDRHSPSLGEQRDKPELAPGAAERRVKSAKRERGKSPTKRIGGVVEANTSLDNEMRSAGFDMADSYDSSECVTFSDTNLEGSSLLSFEEEGGKGDSTHSLRSRRMGGSQCLEEVKEDGEVGRVEKKLQEGELNMSAGGKETENDNTAPRPTPGLCQVEENHSEHVSAQPTSEKWAESVPRHGDTATAEFRECNGEQESVSAPTDLSREETEGDLERKEGEEGPVNDFVGLEEGSEEEVVCAGGSEDTLQTQALRGGCFN